MHVMLDGRPLQGPTGWRGVGRYVRNLVLGMLAADRSLRLTLLFAPLAGPTSPLDRIASDRAAFAPAAAPPGPQLLWGRLLGPRWIGRHRPDLWHATFLAPPRPPRRLPWVATIHDLIPLDHPARFSAKQRAVFARSLAISAAAPHVVAVSAVTARAIQARFGTPSARISVIPPAVDVDAYAQAPARGLPGVVLPYLLHLGGFDPLKGVDDLLLPAFAQIAARRSDLRLALTGPDGPARERVRAVARRLGIEDRILLVGLLDDAAQIAAVAGSAAVVVSSHEEGFGLPAVEALAAGVPLALGPAAASREVAGEQACVASAPTAAALAEAIEGALASGGADSAAAQARRRHAAPFHPRVVGAQMLALYRQLLERSK